MSIKKLLMAAACAVTMISGTDEAAVPVEYTVGTGATYSPFEFQKP